MTEYAYFIFSNICILQQWKIFYSFVCFSHKTVTMLRQALPWMVWSNAIGLFCLNKLRPVVRQWRGVEKKYRHAHKYMCVCTTSFFQFPSVKIHSQVFSQLEVVVEESLPKVTQCGTKLGNMWLGDMFLTYNHFVNVYLKVHFLVLC